MTTTKIEQIRFDDLPADIPLGEALRIKAARGNQLAQRILAELSEGDTISKQEQQLIFTLREWARSPEGRNLIIRCGVVSNSPWALDLAHHAEHTCGFGDSFDQAWDDLMTSRRGYTDSEMEDMFAKMKRMLDEERG